MPSVNVIFHIDESEKWPLVLANVRNLTCVVDVPSSDIEVLVNSKAVSVFNGITLPAHTETIAELAHLGVQFAVCRHSLNGLQISVESLPAFIEVVSVGVLELIEKQNKGAAYIKP
jgi:uncharacterized protein